MRIEQNTHVHPWTCGNFQDSLRAGHHAWVMIHNDEFIGYAVTMVVLDEAQLLNLSIATPFQRQGYGSALLRHVNKEAAAMGADHVFLEVRASNVPAITLYQKVGFIEVSVRKGYYPLGQ
ncbi:MAG TPA: ribosomal protein S18-alanine N-acetyltransferase, partial [Methylophilaceae bacterium]|nr:ribosomal protein S18-alanine N-acetyltransferase [Methylophilaceae bacterium]